MSDRSKNMLKFVSFEIKATVMMEDGTTVEKVFYDRSPPNGFALANTKMEFTKPLVPFFAHPADMHPIGFRLAGPSCFNLHLEDWTENGTIVLNDDTIISVNDPKLEGLSPEEFLQRPAAISTIRGALTATANLDDASTGWRKS